MLEFSEGLKAMAEEQRPAIKREIKLSVLHCLRSSITPEEYEVARADGSWLDEVIERDVRLAMHVHDRSVVVRADTSQSMGSLEVVGAPAFTDRMWLRVLEVIDEVAGMVEKTIMCPAVVIGEWVCHPSEITQTDVAGILRQAANLAVLAEQAGLDWATGLANKIQTLHAGSAA